MDKKTLLTNDNTWDHSIERDTFGNQHPYAHINSSLSAPSAPYNPNHNLEQIAQVAQDEAPPVYSSQEAALTSAPRDPQLHTSQDYPPSPQHQQQPHQEAPSTVSNSFEASHDPYGQNYLRGYQPAPQQDPIDARAYSHDQRQLDQSPRSSAHSVNYGAIQPVLGRDSNASQDTKLPAEAPNLRRRPRRYRKESSSCCYNCCCFLFLAIIVLCWYLKDISLFGGNCTVSDLSFTSADVFGFPPGSIFDLSYAAQDGIIGNVAIKESDEWDEKQIVVRVSYGASTAELFDSMSALILLNETAMVGSAAFFLRGVTPEAKKKLLRGNCARADVEIVYPRTRPGTGRLMVDILNGDISAEFDRHLGSKPATFDELVLKSMNGDIQLEHVPVLKNLTMFTANGHIYGSVRTGSVLGVSVVNGPIDLAVDTVPIPGADKHWNAMGLDANLLTINGHITLDISPSFEGHFELETAVGRPSVVAKDPINYVTKTATNLKGWVSADGQEPVTVLPKLAMFAANGNVKVKVSKE